MERSTVTVLRFLVYAVLLGAADGHTLRDIRTSCDVAVNNSGRKLTCHFDVDLNGTKLDCIVQRYELDPTDRTPDRVISCNWRPTDELNCQEYGSYKLNGHVTDSVVIELPETEREGRYLCQIITNVQKRQEFCTFRQNDGTSVSQTSLDDGRSANLQVHRNTDTAKQGSVQNTQHYNVAGVAVGVVSAVLVIACVPVVVFLVLRRRRRRNTNKPSTQYEEESESLKDKESSSPTA